MEIGGLLRRDPPPPKKKKIRGNLLELRTSSQGQVYWEADEI